jgi:hypothetical protein
MAARVHWAGRLEHEELADVLPAAEALAMPSTFPEAFGMVAAEAAACGALPVVAGHSGMARSPARSPRRCPAEVRPWLTFESGPHAVSQLAEASRGGSRRRPSCARHAGRRSSGWPASATPGTAWRARLIAAAEGRLDGLPQP